MEPKKQRECSPRINTVKDACSIAQSVFTGIGFVPGMCQRSCQKRFFSCIPEETCTVFCVEDACVRIAVLYCCGAIPFEDDIAHRTLEFMHPEVPLENQMSRAYRLTPENRVVPDAILREITRLGLLPPFTPRSPKSLSSIYGRFIEGAFAKMHGEKFRDYFVDPYYLGQTADILMQCCLNPFYLDWNSAIDLFNALYRAFPLGTNKCVHVLGDLEFMRLLLCVCGKSLCGSPTESDYGLLFERMRVFVGKYK